MDSMSRCVEQTTTKVLDLLLWYVSRVQYSLCVVLISFYPLYAVFDTCSLWYLCGPWVVRIGPFLFKAIHCAVCKGKR